MEDEPRKRPPGDRDENARKPNRPRPEKRAAAGDATPYRLRDEPQEPPARPAPPDLGEYDEEEDRPRRRRRPKVRRAPSFLDVIGKVRLVIICIGLLVLLIAGIVWIVVAVGRNNQAAPFKPALAAYLAAPSGKAPESASRLVTGKMVVVDVKTKDIDTDVLSRLPAEIRAAKPDEVGVVVWVSWGKDKIGTYKDADTNEEYPAFVQTCQVTLIDAQQHQVLLEKEVRGGEPPTDADDVDGEIVGDRPTDQVAAYLAGLPRK